MKKIKKNIHIVIFASILFMYFFYLCYKTPLAGDDWGYSINGLKDNPFITAFDFYFNWSGRYLGEVFGFIFANHKMIWNICNAGFFAGVYIILNKLIDSENKWVTAIISFFLMISVSDQIRMETYTWITGTGFYVIPLLLLFVVLYCYQKLLIECKKKEIYYYVIALASFMSCLMMESVAALLLMLNGAVLLVHIFILRKNIGKLPLVFIMSLIGFVILRSSPGAAYRLASNHADWLELNIFEQIIINWENLINYTLIENEFLIFVLSIIGLIASIKILKKNIRIVSSIVFVIGILQSTASRLYNYIGFEGLKIFYDLSNTTTIYVTTVITILLVIAVGIIIWNLFEYEKTYKAYLILVSSIILNAGMMLSPIFGPRNSIYTVYMIILLICLIVSNLEFNKYFKFGIIIPTVVLSAIIIKNDIYLYNLTADLYEVRLGEIEYYKNNPDSEEAWIIRMPEGSIHSVDVEEWDTYHMETFKEYFGLNPDTKVIFYFAD